MKISQMLQREDFYKINEQTLTRYFGINSQTQTTLYIYPQLNAIVSANPSKEVVDYLLCEYSVRGNKAKQLAARAYVLSCMKSQGLLAAKKCIVHTENNSSLLIYPCNKKYRVFDFKRQTVAVTPKCGFNDTDLQHEIAFRSQKDLPNFVPGFVSCDKLGYQEKIIDGRPLARISDDYEGFRDEAYRLLTQFCESQSRYVPAKPYAVELVNKIEILIKQKANNEKIVKQITTQFLSMVTEEDKVMLTFSHGDLQPGNIWVENGTNHIYIIDWESWGIRSKWYDKNTLYGGLRPGHISGYLSQKKINLEYAIVLLEDMVFHIHELNSLPDKYGMEEFISYCSEIMQWIKEGVQDGNKETV